jgi:hypothetical protein
MDDKAPLIDRFRGHPAQRVVSGFVLALVIAFSAYLLFSASRSGSGWFASIWFLALLPAVLSATICYIGDPGGTRSSSFYWWVPPILCALVCAGSAFFLHEGVICLAMISPVWMISGWIGAFAIRVERTDETRTSIRTSLLIIPLAAGVVEAQIPIPHETVTLTRSIVVQATPEEIWPHAVSSRGIGPHEGRWTLTHNILGIPRPRQSITAGAGVGAVRTAYWGDHINFEERIVAWEPGRKLGWRFNFTNSSVQDYTDKHIAPDGQFLDIESGDYTLRRRAPGVTEVTLTTRYIAKTHVNPYARLWGELIMGDVEINILAIIKARAERAHAQNPAFDRRAG